MIEHSPTKSGRISYAEADRLLGGNPDYHGGNGMYWARVPGGFVHIICEQDGTQYSFQSLREAVLMFGSVAGVLGGLLAASVYLIWNLA